VKRLMGRRYRSPEVGRMRPYLGYQIVENVNGDAWVNINGKSYSPQEISAQILRKMKATAEDYFGEEIGEAVITVPAYFDDAQRQATKDAGKIAGLNVRRIVNEPTAAALAYGFQTQKREARIAVFDLGGGTFDVSVLQLRNGVFEVLATSGDNMLGGDDFDRAVLEFLVERFRRDSGIDISGDKMALQRLREAAENAKCELSTLTETNINLPFLAVDNSGPRHLSLSLSRGQLEELCHDLVESLERPCYTALDGARLAAEDIDEVLLVGGMTRMPLVQRKVVEIFKKEPRKGVNPDEVVAIGAAVQSGILDGEIREVVLLDVTPMALGIRVEGDRFSPIIAKNTSIPARASKIFTTTKDDQEVVTVTVVQGDQQKASRNRMLGVFNLHDIPRAKAGTPRVEVTFDIDTDGIIHITAREITAGVTQSITVSGNSGLSEHELDFAIQRNSMR
jgi:molecular chaperone DnaK